MKFNQIIFFLAILLTSTSVFAQKGTVRGTINDQKTGEALMFTNVVVLNTSPVIGAQTDLDGNYELTIDAGTYSLEVSYVGYTSKTITDVVVKADDITVVDFPMSDESMELAEVVVKATRLDRSENALLMLQKKSYAIQDGISSQEMSRIGSSNAAESAKRVSGASVIGGKYVNIRGLSDRYINTQMNGIQLPSTNPYRNSTPLDLIPANLLDNLVITKTFTPDQPGTVTGGNVNLKTKSFPERFTLSFSASTTYNTVSSLNDNFLTYQGGKTDWLGYDDGTRAIPSILQDQGNKDLLTSSAYIRSRTNDEIAGLVDQASKSLNAQKTATTMTTPLDQSVSFSVGNQVQVGNNPLGFLVGVNYRRNYRSKVGLQRTNPESPGLDAATLNENFNLTGSEDVENAQVGALANVSYKFGGTNKLSFNVFYNHDAEKGAGFLSGPYNGIISGNNDFQTRSLLFQERELLSLQLMGEHVFPDLNNLKVEWAGSNVALSQSEPDLRFFANTFDSEAAADGQPAFFISPAEYPLPFHYFRDLADVQRQAKVDFTLPITKNKANKIKFGASYSAKERTFEEERFQIQTKSGNGAGFSGDADAFFAADNTGIIGTDNRDRNIIGLFVTDENVAANNYTGTENILAGYAMTSYEFNKFQFIGGLRIETTDFTVTSADETKAQGRIDEVDFLPSANLIYRLNEVMNIRGSFTQTLARPNMREVAPFSAFDFIGGPIFTGNPELQRTLIQNFDLRWELFPKAGEIIAVSAYYKNFDNPIISAFIPSAQNPEIKPINVDEAKIYGVELEYRKNLGFISNGLKDFKFSTNVSFIHSETEVQDVELVSIRENFISDFDAKRPFQDQSPFLFNASLTYNNLDNGLDGILSFNNFGDRLAEASLSGLDNFEKSRPQLDFSIRKRFAEKYSVKFGVDNILNSDFQKVINYNDTEYVFERYQRGVSFKVGFSYDIR